MRSRNLQSRMIATILILFCCTLFPLQPVKYLSADPSGDFFNSAIPDNEETRKLLEQTLSSAEIEREIIKITAEQKALEQKVESLNRQATQKKTAIADQQERAGAVVRSYYMGDRDNLLAAFFQQKVSADSWLCSIIMRLLLEMTAIFSHNMKNNIRI